MWLKLTGDSSTVAFNLNSYPNVNDASNANLNLDYMNGGWSNVSGAFRTVTDVILASGNGKRTGVPSICFLIVAFPPVIDADQTATERERLEAICRLIILVVGDPNVSLRVFWVMILILSVWSGIDNENFQKHWIVLKLLYSYYYVTKDFSLCTVRKHLNPSFFNIVKFLVMNSF